MTNRPRRALITLTGGNIRNGHVYLHDHLGCFPRDCVGGTNAASAARRPISLLFAATGEQVETDIAGDKKIFRARAPIRRFFHATTAAPGDKVQIDTLNERSYQISLIRA